MCNLAIECLKLLNLPLSTETLPKLPQRAALSPPAARRGRRTDIDDTPGGSETEEVLFDVDGGGWTPAAIEAAMRGEISVEPASLKALGVDGNMGLQVPAEWSIDADGDDDDGSDEDDDDAAGPSAWGGGTGARGTGDGIEWIGEGWAVAGVDDATGEADADDVWGDWIDDDDDASALGLARGRLGGRSGSGSSAWAREEAAEAEAERLGEELGDGLFPESLRDRALRGAGVRSAADLVDDDDDDNDDDDGSRGASTALGAAALLARQLPDRELRALSKHQTEGRRLREESRRRRRKDKAAELATGTRVHGTHKRLRIVGGAAAGRRLVSPRDERTRPMMEKVRSAAFDMLLSAVARGAEAELDEAPVAAPTSAFAAAAAAAAAAAMTAPPALDDDLAAWLSAADDDEHDNEYDDDDENESDDVRERWSESDAVAGAAARRVRAATGDGGRGLLPEGSRWLDLYAGTGSIGIEALSRGAASSTFVELDPWVVTD